METTHGISWIILLSGALIVLNILLASGCKRCGVPELVGYLVLGFGLRLVASRWQILNADNRMVLDFLAHLGVIALLFRVGLESKPLELLHHLRQASGIAVANVAVSGAVAYAAATYLLGLDLIPSLIVGTAAVATSVGLTVGVWREAGALDTGDGKLLIDVAETDDVLGVVLMALLFAVIPTLRGGDSVDFATVGKTAALVLGKLVLFGAGCIVFSRFIEEKITNFMGRVSHEPAPMLVVVGLGMAIAALAGVLGFSVAIGAFFAGLIFSRDPQSVKIDTSFESLYSLFTPFFFIGIGLQIDPGSLTGALKPGAILLVAAVVGKVFGAAGPALLTTTWTSALLIGVSMVPRAEIFMVIMERGRNLGEWAVSSETFSAMVLVSAVTCLFTPVFLQRMLRRRETPEDAIATD